MTNVYEQLREQIASNRLQAEKMRGAHLERSRRLVESQYDWVGPYADMIEKYRREPFLAGPTARRDRQGRNYPIYQTEAELALLRAPSRVLCATNTYAIGLIEGITSYVLGNGLTYRAAAKVESAPPELVAACQAEIDAFLVREQWYGGEQPSMEEELLWRECEDGESILAHYCDEEGQTTCRTVEPEQLTSPDKGDTRWSFGIYTTSDDVQKHLKYWVQWGDSVTDGREMDPDDIVHVRRNVKRSSKRGVPDFCFDMLDALQLGGRLRINMSDAAAQQAAIVGVRQHAGASKQDVEEFIKANEDFESAGPGVTISSGKRETNNYLRRGHWEDIDDGQMYVGGPLATNGMVHLEILQACLRGAAVRWNAPEWLVSGLHDTSSFASSLTAESPFTRRIIRCQRTVCEARRRTMLTVVRNRCKHRRLIALGRAWSWQEVERMVDILAEAPSPEVRDALAEAQTAAIEIPLGVDSRQRYTQAHGRDWDQVQQDNTEYAEANGPAIDLDDPTSPDVGTTNPVVESRQVVESFREGDHPRDDQGRFVSKEEIADAKGDPTKKAELRDRVTDPGERKKLDAALGDKPEEKAPPKPKTKKAREDLAKSKQQEWLQGMAEAGVKPSTPRSPEAKALETSLLQGLGQLKSGQEMIGPGKFRDLTDAEYAGVLRTVNSAIAQLKDKSTWK
jgi:hypothetical protein